MEGSIHINESVNARLRDAWGDTLPSNANLADQLQIAMAERVMRETDYDEHDEETRAAVRAYLRDGGEGWGRD